MTEAQIQRAVVQHLKAYAAPNAVYWHTPNGGRRDAIDGANFKRLGVRPGVSDILVFHKRELFALELKRDGGRATESQLRFLDDIRREGGYGVIAEGLDEALASLRAWGVLR